MKAGYGRRVGAPFGGESAVFEELQECRVAFDLCHWPARGEDADNPAAAVLEAGIEDASIETLQTYHFHTVARFQVRPQVCLFGFIRHV